MVGRYSDNYFRKSESAMPPLESVEDLSIVASDDDEHSSSGGAEDSRGSTAGAAKNAPAELVKRETKAVSFLRYFILVLMLVSGIGITIGFYRISTDAEEAANQCPASLARDDLVRTVENNVHQVISSQLREAFLMSASFSSHVLQSGLAEGGFPMQWPYVTIPHFDPRALPVLSANGVVEVAMAPLVRGTDQSSFKTYALLQQQQDCTFDGCVIIRDIFNADGTRVGTADFTSPIWQMSPRNFMEPGDLLLNQFSDPVQQQALTLMQEQGAAVYSAFNYDSVSEEEDTAPEFFLFYPIYQDFKQVDMVGSISMRTNVQGFLESIFPFSMDRDITIVLQSCDEAISFSLKGNEMEFLGTLEEQNVNQIKDVEETAILEFSSTYTYGQFDTRAATATSCGFSLMMVPSNSVGRRLTDETADTSNRPIVLTSLVAITFLVTMISFLLYDWLVERRQAVVINIANKSTAIVENLFPAQVRDRMLQNIEERRKKASGLDVDQAGIGDAGATPVEQLNGSSAPTASAPQKPNQVSVKQFLTTDQHGQANDLSSQPIADLFPNTTVLFADISGFTAWASQRDPPQVFTLLETLYRSFDVIAKKLKVFKVETIGDCYMAVTGLPNPDESHAVHMSRFAYQCLVGMKVLICELEGILGPGTSELALRVGLHSGAVTAGVLRGEKSRFQLFGDTVNTASRMESTSERGRIQVSQETADLLMAAGKSHWLKPREELVVAKGKGELKTYWLDPTKKRRHTKTHKDIRVSQDIALNNGSATNLSGELSFDDKYARLIDWNVDVLLHHLARVISCRSRSPPRGSLVNHSSEVALLPAAINDVAEVVALPPFDADSSRFRRARPDVSMLQQTRADLHEYVKRIALLYRDVPFHNFEHASHVTLCANKLLNRLINSDEYDSEEELHNATYGISSDPLTHFAIVFAALIHDADHTGVPNAQLIKDKHEVAMKFENKSVAEQNSVHLGWELLMDPRFERLRKSIYQTNVERKRFRQLVINSVLATDIADRQVNENRQLKWEKAFKKSSTEDATPLQLQEDMNRKATAVIEHIIQVSDVAHTMQHWHIYRRWNERLFHEMHEAYQTGRVAVDPSTNWYIGELGFFDYYLIPLAMKLKECGVFGASGYEYISYVLKNKKEWERKGRQVVQEMVLLYKDADEDQESSFDSDYDSDDLEYDSPGDLTSDEEEEEGDEEDQISENMQPIQKDV
ncbi:adenylate/guanylate cyclase with GAF and PAS/PAC sensor domain [Nitzschia inconspicua]|uniref:Adenylate/guanylate cyclase with GAF and PAS/PAC sensor domain n=1 Tax=Nitzschia inconspicua TaxID=303405 RepID=A0A9K3KWF6_9STRA|nr:adenylate/guanylate cyclase with GAF and PAS/PAC sensor domain [Nitzschia inconspicua]